MVAHGSRGIGTRRHFMIVNPSLDSNDDITDVQWCPECLR